MWSPSSLIFLVLLGVWAAYFLQYWIRRRDHLATARSVEQFSEAMRVLEQRDTTPRTDLSEPAPRSWNVHPARPARPQVLVKRAVPAEVPSPVVTARVETPAAPEAPEREPRPAPGRPAPAPPAETAPVGRAPAERPLPTRIRPSRRTRAVLMLVALVELAVIATLVPLGMLAWWALAPAVVALLASFAYVRSGVRAERDLRAARRRRQAEQTRRRAAASPAERTPHRSGAERRRGVATPAPADQPASADESATAAAVLTDDEITAEREDDPVEAAPAVAHGVAAFTAEPEVVPAAPETEAAGVVEEIEYRYLVDEDDIPLTWDPVPVPRPTYTMKARAERPEVPPAEVTPDPASVARPDDEPLDERRVAGA